MKNTWQIYLAAALKALRQATGDELMCGDSFPGRPRYSRQAAESLRVLIPYCLHPVPLERPTLIWLNRYYKPIGTFSDLSGSGTGCMPYVDYADFRHLHIEATHPAVEVVGRSFPAYLFDDTCPPWASAASARRLAVMLSQILALAREKGRSDFA